MIERTMLYYLDSRVVIYGFTVKTGTYKEAEYGQGGGAIISLLLRLNGTGNRCR